MTQASNKENNYNVFVISAVFLLGAFITFLNSTFMNVALSDIMEELNIIAENKTCCLRLFPASLLIYIIIFWYNGVGFKSTGRSHED